ncbi:hypothetical protein DIZ27_39870 [Streptomyces sp. NWU339]|nr:hypothetical protein DIZ27_39870 [Streptomyces sp. NWU339]
MYAPNNTQSLPSYSHAASRDGPTEYSLGPDTELLWLAVPDAPIVAILISVATPTHWDFTAKPQNERVYALYCTYTVPAGRMLPERTMGSAWTYA